MQTSNTMKRLTVAFGIIMAAVMALSVVLPTMGRSTTTQSSVQPTQVPVPTFPPPPDTAAITFDNVYLHPSGLYSVAQPTGWPASQPESTDTNARSTFTNPGAQSVIQVDVETLLRDAPLTLDDVDARYTQAALGSSWSNYSSWRETGSRVRTEDGKLQMDFALTAQNMQYVARQLAWTDGEWLYSVRVVTPDNATEALRFVLNGVAASIVPNKLFAGTPFGWSAYHDTVYNHIVRFPKTWTVADSAAGRPASVSGPAGEVLRVEAQAGVSVADADAARAWAEAARPGATVLNVTPVSRTGGDGFAVAYGFTDADGEAQSGLVVLLNGADGALHSANLRFLGSSVDLTTDAGRAAQPELAQIMDTFAILPPLTPAAAE